MSLTPQVDLTSELRIGCVVKELQVRVQLCERRCFGTRELLDLVGDRDIECVGTGARAVCHCEYPVAGLRLVQDGREPERDSARVGVSNDWREKTCLHLDVAESELLCDPGGELPVGLMEHGICVILRRSPRPLHQAFPAVEDVLEVR